MTEVIEVTSIGGRDSNGNFVFKMIRQNDPQQSAEIMIDCNGKSGCSEGDLDALGIKLDGAENQKFWGQIAGITKSPSDSAYASYATILFFEFSTYQGEIRDQRRLTADILYRRPEIADSDAIKWTSLQLLVRDGSPQANYFIGYEHYTYWLMTQGGEIHVRASWLTDASVGRVNKMAAYFNKEGVIDVYIVGAINQHLTDLYGQMHPTNEPTWLSGSKAGLLSGFDEINSLVRIGKNYSKTEPTQDDLLELSTSDNSSITTQVDLSLSPIIWVNNNLSIGGVIGVVGLLRSPENYSMADLGCGTTFATTFEFDYVWANCAACMQTKTSEPLPIPFYDVAGNPDPWFDQVGWLHKNLQLADDSLSPFASFSSTNSMVIKAEESHVGSYTVKLSNTDLYNYYISESSLGACGAAATIKVEIIKFEIEAVPQQSIQRNLGLWRSDPIMATFSSNPTGYTYELQIFQLASSQLRTNPQPDHWLEGDQLVIDSSTLQSNSDFYIVIQAWVLKPDGSSLCYDVADRNVNAYIQIDFQVTPETDQIGIASFIYSWSKDSASQPMTVPIEMPANLVNASPGTVTTIVRHYATSAEVTKASFSVARNTLSVVVNDIDDFADSQYQISDLQIYAQIAIAGEDIQYHASNTFTVSMFTYEAVEVQDLTYEMNESAHTAWLRLQMPIFKGSMLPPSRNCTLYSGDRKILAEETTAEWVTYDAAKNDDRVLISTRDFDLLGAYSFDLACTVTVGALSQTTWNPFMIHLVPSPWVDLPEPEPLEAYVEHQVSLQPQVIYAGVPYSWPVSPALLQGNATSVELASEEFLSWHLSFDQAGLMVSYDGGAEAIESTYTQLNFTVFDSDQDQLGQYAQEINLLPREAYADPLDLELQEQGKGEGQGDADADSDADANADELSVTPDGTSRVTDSALGQQTKANIFKFVPIQKRAEDFEDLTTLIKDQRELQMDASLQARLASVSNSGVATITFSRSLQFSEGIKERINQEADSDSDSDDSTPLLEVTLMNQVDGVVSPNLVSWKAISVEDDQIELQLTFEDPMEVSNDELPDLLHVQLAMSEFKSQRGDLTLPASLVKRYPVPPQHPSHAAYQVFMTTGSTTMAAMMGASSSSAVVQFAMSASLAQLFAVLNSQQMVVYLPLLRATKLPANVVTFNSLMIQLASFDLIDTETIDEALYSLPEVDPFNANFAQFGFESLWLVGNSGFLLWVLYGYAVFAAIVYASKRKCCKLEGYPRLRKLLQSLERNILWNGLTRLHMEAYLDIAIFTFLNLSQTRSEHANPTVYYSTLLSSVLALFLLVGPPLLLCHAYRKRATWGDEGYQARHGALLEGTAPLGVNGEPGLKAWQIILIPTVFYTRRFVFAMSIVFITRALSVQMSLQMGTSLLLTAYLTIVKPLESQRANRVEILNEVTSLLLMYILMGFNDVVPDPMTRYIVGAVYVFVNLGNILVLFYLVGRDAFISFKHKLRTKKCCRRLFEKRGRQAASIGASQSQERASNYAQKEQEQGQCKAAPLSQINEAAEEDESSNSDHGESSPDEQKNPKITLRTLPKPQKNKPVNLIPAVPFITVTRTQQLEFSAKIDKAERQIARNMIMQKYHESAPTAEQLRIVHETGVKLPVQKLIDRFQQARAKAKPRLLDSLQFEMCKAASAEGSSASIRRRTSQQMYDQIEEEAKKWME